MPDRRFGLEDVRCFLPEFFEGAEADAIVAKATALREAGVTVYSGKLSAGQTLITPVAHVVYTRVAAEAATTATQWFFNASEAALERGNKVLKYLGDDAKPGMEEALNKITVALAAK